MKVILILFLIFFAQFYFSECQVYLTPQQVQNMTFDYIIVGGGTGGATVAKRLSEKSDLKILIIEAGGVPSPFMYVPGLFIFHTINPATWQYPIVKPTECFKSFPKLVYPQAKVLGGGSSINAIMYVRGSKQNHDDWAALGLNEWSYEKVLPYYIKAEGNTITGQMNNGQYHGTKGPLTVSQLSSVTSTLATFIQAGEEIGLPQVDYNLPNQTGVGELDFTIRNGSRCSTYLAYLDAIPTNTNLYISVFSTATKITFTNKSATGVNFVNGGTNFHANATREVIVSCGSFGSPKLLMLSGIGQKQQLKKFNVKE